MSVWHYCVYIEVALFLGLQLAARASERALVEEKRESAALRQK